MNQVWKDIITQLVAQLVQIFGPVFQSWFEKILNGTAHLLPDPEQIIKVGAAPNEVLAKFESIIDAWITTTFARFPFVTGIIVNRVNVIVETVVNKYYDQFFNAQIATGSALSLAAMPARASALTTPPNPTPTELAACRAEAGI